MHSAISAKLIYITAAALTGTTAKRQIFDSVN